MLINILCLIIGITTTFIWIKVVKAKTPINYQEFAKDKFWLIFTSVTIVAVAYLYFYLPQVFKWLAVDIWGIPASSLGEDKEIKVLQLTDLGPLGDIYGSLNTLFTSATLAFVVYATLLQRQANADARSAMFDQLQQAKDATKDQLQQAKDASDEQLRQARDALTAQLDQAKDLTEQQIINAKELANTQLKQANASTAQQLELALATHEAQIQESRNSIFTNQFYALLNYKNERVKSLILKNSDNLTIIGYELFSIINTKFFTLFEKVEYDFENIDEKKLRAIFIEICHELNNKKGYFEIFSYFEIYSSLIELMKTTKLDNETKEFYWSLVRNSMTGTEQKALFYLAPIWTRLYNSLENSHLFNSFSPHNGSTNKFALKFYKKIISILKIGIVFLMKLTPQHKLGFFIKI